MYGNDNDMAARAGGRMLGRLVIGGVVGLVCLVVTVLCRCCRRGRSRGGVLAPPPAAASPAACFGGGIPLPPPTSRVNPQPATAPADAHPPAYSQVVMVAKQLH